MTRRMLHIETPEGVWFTVELATPLARSLALGIDTTLIIGVGSLVGQLSQYAKLVNADFSAAVGMLLLFLFWNVYSLALEWVWKGKTVGKRILGLQVMDVHGMRLHPGQIVLRNLLRCFDWLPIFYLVGGAFALCSSKFQRLGDYAANTVVVRHRRAELPDFEGVLGSRYNSLLEQPVFAARLRAKVSAEAAAIALRALADREQFDPQARVALFREIAAYFRSLQPFPAELVEGLSDEVFVRNVAEVVFASSSRIRGA